MAQDNLFRTTHIVESIDSNTAQGISSSKVRLTKAEKAEKAARQHFGLASEAFDFYT